jgi:hypothetical protein
LAAMNQAAINSEARCQFKTEPSVLQVPNKGTP